MSNVTVSVVQNGRFFDIEVAGRLMLNLNRSEAFQLHNALAVALVERLPADE